MKLVANSLKLRRTALSNLSSFLLSGCTIARLGLLHNSATAGLELTGLTGSNRQPRAAVLPPPGGPAAASGESLTRNALEATVSGGTVRRLSSEFGSVAALSTLNLPDSRAFQFTCSFTSCALVCEFDTDSPPPAGGRTISQCTSGFGRSP